MKIINYVSVKEILWKVLKNPLAAELTLVEAAEYALEAIQLLGAPVAFEDKIGFMDLVFYKAELPCDIITIQGIRYLNRNWDGQGIGSSGNSGYGTPAINGIALRESTDVYQLDPTEFINNYSNENDVNDASNGGNSNYPHNQNYNEFTYTIKKGIIYSSIKEGKLEIAYKGIAVDEDGYPLIPNNVKVKLFMEYYILSRYLEPIYLMGKITDKAYDFILTKRYFYTASAFTGLQMPSIDGMQSMMGAINRLIINTTAHSDFFKKAGDQERFRRML